MKTNFAAWNRSQTNKSAAGLIGLACLASLIAHGQDAKPDPKKAEASSEAVELRNWIDVTVGGNLIHGDKAAFQQRTGQPRDAWGGVTDFHYELDVGKKGLFEVDGRGIYDAHNYSLSLSLKDPDLGYVKAGFEEFCSYYDLSGGYFPGNGQFIELYPQTGEVDRRRIFFEAGLTLENKPQVRVRYEYDGREGDKNSTIWGNTTRTGVLPAANASRGIVPTLNQLNEDRHTFIVDLSQAIGNTGVGIGGRAAFSSYDNNRLIHRSPGETTPAAAPPDRRITHREGIETDLLSAHAFTDTDFNDQVKLTTAYAFTRMETDLSGDRAIGAAFYASPLTNALQSFANRQNRDHGFYGLAGGSVVNQHVATISVMYRPTPHLTLVPSFRVESQTQNGATEFFDVEVNSARNAIQEDVRNTRERDFLDVTESLEARYTGVTNWLFYARAELLQGTGHLRETDKILEDVAFLIQRDTDSSRFTQKYVAGANWYPHRRVSIAAQYYHRVRENEFEDIFDSTPAVLPAPGQGYYPGFIENQIFTTDDVNIRLTLRPMNSLTLVSRYDLQYSTIDTRMENRAEAQSAESSAHIITESITWMPITRMYVQLSGSYTLDRLRSPANDILPSRLQISENDYYTVSGTVGYALTEKTDLTATYALFVADNYDPTIFLTGLPLGASLEEHTIGATVVHRFSRRLQLTTRYAFMTSHEETTGGRNDYDAHLISSTLRFRF